MCESERRASGKQLQKQLEVEDDDLDSSLTGQDNVTMAGSSANVGTNNGHHEGGTTYSQTTDGEDETTQSGQAGPKRVNLAGMRTPTIQSASSSSETPPDESVPQPNIPPQPSITRKQTLTRTHALEGTSPPPESLTVSQSSGPARATSPSSGNQQSHGRKADQSPNLLLASYKISSDSGHGTLDTTDTGSDTSVLSRDSSLESSAANLYKDSSGVNIPHFIRETMLKSAKDKRTVLAYEKQLIDFCRNDSSHVLKMAEASSYDRMIAHRLSAFMGLEHNVDQTGKSVIINKTENMRIVKITDSIKLDDGEQDTKKKILKKPASLDEKHSHGTSKGQFGSHRAKSLEERQQRYSEVRERIFKDGENQSDEQVGPLLSTNYMLRIHQHRSLDSAQQTSTSTAAAPPPPISTTSLHPGHYSNNQHHHLLHTHRSASTDLTHHRYGQGASDLRATTMIKSNSYGGMGYDPTVYPGPLGPEPAFVDLPKDMTSSTVYRSSPNQQVPNHPPPAPAPQPPTVSSIHPTDHKRMAADDWPGTVSSPSVQPHVNADGSVYKFDPSCPPPFMIQPVVQPSPPTGSIHYQLDNHPVSEVINTSSDDQAQGQLVISHPQPSQAIQFSQACPSLSPAPGVVSHQAGPYQLMAYTPAAPTHHHQLHAIPHLVQAAAPLEFQGQPAVPMPAIGVPAIPHGLTHTAGAPTAYVLGPAPAQPYEIAGPPQPGSGMAVYAHYPPADTSFNGGVVPAGFSLPQAHQLVQYNLSPFGHTQQQQKPQQIVQLQHQPPHQQQVFVPQSPAVGAPGTTYFTIQQQPGAASTPTPPPQPPHHQSSVCSLAQLPPPPIPAHQAALSHQHQPAPKLNSSHHHQHPTVFYSPGGAPPPPSPSSTYPYPVSINPPPPHTMLHQQPPPQPTTTTTSGQQNSPHKPSTTNNPAAPTFVHYQSSPPPAMHHPHPHTATQSPTPHHQLLTLAAPTKTSGAGPPPSPGMMAYQQIVQSSHHAGQMQPFQVYRPSVSVNPSSIQQRLAALHLSTPASQQSFHKPSYRQQHRRGPKKAASLDTHNLDELSAGPPPGGRISSGGAVGPPPQFMHAGPPHPHTAPQQQAQPVIVAPLLPGMVGPHHPHIPPMSSQRSG